MPNKSRKISLAIIDEILMTFFSGQPDEAKMEAIRTRMVRRIAARADRLDASRACTGPAINFTVITDAPGTGGAKPIGETGTRADLTGTGAVRKIRQVRFEMPKRHEPHQRGAGCSKKAEKRASAVVVCPTCYQTINGVQDAREEHALIQYILEDHLVWQQYSG